jgi:hypothetical protein
MASDQFLNCRLCDAPLRQSESNRRLCAVCDEYAQHVALHRNERIERVVGELQNGSLFVAASRRAH